MQSEQSDVVKSYRPLAELVPKHWQTGSVQAEDGAHIHYSRTGGAKPTLLLIHGIQVSGMMWLRTAQMLEATYDVVMPDVRGHGQSSRMAVGLSKDRLVKDLAVLLGKLGVERPFIAGHSMGAEIAGRLAIIYPARAVALVDPAMHNVGAAMAFDPDNPPPWMVPMIQAMQALKTQPHAERLLSGLRLLPPKTSVWQEADYVSFIEGQAQFDPGFYRYIATLGCLFEEPATIARIDCPVLLLTARPMMPGANIEADATAFKQHWRDGQHVHFADSGHFIPFDQFDRFVEILTAFFGKHNA